MARDSNTWALISLKGERESLDDVITNLYPTEAVLQTNFGLIMSGSEYIEWQTDRLAAPADNEHPDGDVFSAYVTSPNATKRYGVYHQTSGKGYDVSRRAIIADKAGRADEMAYQVVKGLRELRNDVERHAGLRRASRAESDASTPARTAGVPVWMRETWNFFAGSSSSAPGLSNTTDGFPNSVGNTGTARGFTEAQLRTATRNVYDNANEMPEMFVLPPRIKQGFSELLFTSSSARIAAQRQDQGKSPGMGAQVLGAVDLYTDDFATLSIVPSRFVPEGTGSDTDVSETAGTNHPCELMLLNPDYWDISHFSPFHVADIGKGGDSERRLIIVDWALKCRDPGSSAVITGINAGTAVAAG